MLGEKCRRKRVSIGGENFYIVVGKEFIMATVPYENRPESTELRLAVEGVCVTATELMGDYDEIGVDATEEEEGG